MTKYICDKCEKEFTTKSNLTRHLNKKNPCHENKKNKEFECKNCKKIFYLKTNLERHLQRKNPCEKIKNQGDNELEIKFKIMEKETEEKIKIMEKEKEIKLEIIEKQIQKENLVRQKHLEVEEEKNKRKERTTNIINIDNSITINNNIVNNLNIKHADSKEIFNITAINTYIQSCMNKTQLTKLFNDSDTISDVLEHMIKNNYNNENYPYNTCIIYILDNNTFYAKTSETWKKIKFEDIKDEIILIMRSNINKMAEIIDEPSKVNGERYLKYYFMFIKNNIYDEMVLNICKKALDETNRVEVEQVDYDDDKWYLKV